MKLNINNIIEIIIQNTINYTNINNLLNTTKNFAEYKKKYYYWKLNEKYSKKYYSDFNFRSLLLSKIIRPENQISLNLDNIHFIIDTNIVKNINSLSLKRNDIIDISLLKNLSNLDLSYCYNIENIDTLLNLNELNLTGCSKIVNINYLKKKKQNKKIKFKRMY